MKSKLQVFLERYSISTHSLVAFSTLMVTMYFEVPQVHDYVYGVFIHLPAGVKNFIVAVVAAIGFYWRGHRTWTPPQREEAAPVTGSAPPGTSAGGDNPAFVKLNLAPPKSDTNSTPDPGW